MTDQHSSESEDIREHLERYRGVTLQTLDLVPDEKLSWKPSEGLRSFAEQFLHIAQTEDYYVRGLFDTDWNMDRFARPKAELTRTRLQEKLAEVRAFTLAKLDRLDPKHLGALATVPGIPVQWSLRSWLWYVLEHEVHHKAQLALYLRNIGILPPFFATVLPLGVRPDATLEAM